MTTITCKIPDHLDAKLEAAARQRRVPKSEIVREALEQRLVARRGRGKTSAFDLVKSLCGSLNGPTDLSANAAYLEDLGG